SQNRDAVARRNTADIQIRGNNRPTWTHAGRELRGDRTVSGADLEARVPGEDPRVLQHRLRIAVVQRTETPDLLAAVIRCRVEDVLRSHGIAPSCRPVQCDNGRSADCRFTVSRRLGPLTTARGRVRLHT